MPNPMPARIGLTLYRGDSRVWTDTFVLPSGTPFDLTGYTATAEVRADAEASQVMAVFDVELTDPAAGVLVMSLSPQESAKLKPPRAYWDLQLVSPDGYVRTYLAGPVQVIGDLSR
jgi:hypothetical protein